MRHALPALGVLALLVLLGIGLTLDPRRVPSPLIGKPAPAFTAERLVGEGSVSEADLRGAPVLVNFFASWCTPCLVEHPLFMRLAREGAVRIVGVNYKDAPEDARRWLRRHGDPYEWVAKDPQGRIGLDWGVYGVPETFLLAADGTVLHKHVGPIDDKIWARDFQPRLAGASP